MHQCVSYLNLDDEQSGDDESDAEQSSDAVALRQPRTHATHDHFEPADASTHRGLSSHFSLFFHFFKFRLGNVFAVFF